MKGPFWSLTSLMEPSVALEVKQVILWHNCDLVKAAFRPNLKVLRGCKMLQGWATVMRQWESHPINITALSVRRQVVEFFLCLCSPEDAIGSHSTMLECGCNKLSWFGLWSVFALCNKSFHVLELWNVLLLRAEQQLFFLTFTACFFFF